MATEIYTPPSPQQPTKIYRRPDDQTGSVIYADPTKDLFAGNVLFASEAPIVVEA